MQVKVFEADDMKSALQQVRETLGADALILSTRELRKGGLGVLSRPRIEVTAAVEPPSGGRAPASAPKQSRAGEEEISYADIWKKRRVIDPIEEELEGVKGQLASLDIDSIRGELDSIKRMMSDVVLAKSDRHPAPPAPGRSEGRDRWLAALADYLDARGLDGAIVEKLVQLALTRLDARQKGDPATVRAFCRQAIAGMLKVSGPITFDGKGPRKVALVGPTGVGKTTTAAKMAADYLLQKGRSVALVTIDIYRIAAAEQLKVYGEIMNVPVEVVISPEQLGEVFARHRDKELILIDTAGRSPRDNEGIAELGRFLGPDSGTENHLVLSATTREREIAVAVRQFGQLPLHRMIFTKLDECENLGAVVNVPLKHRMELSYLANGQRVPEDLMLAYPKQVAGMVLGHK